LTALKQKYLISGTIRRENGVQVRVVNEASPASEAQLVTPSLEDVYLHLVSGNGARQ
jgi:hypothetical protein